MVSYYFELFNEGKTISLSNLIHIYWPLEGQYIYTNNKRQKLNLRENYFVLEMNEKR